MSFQILSLYWEANTLYSGFYIFITRSLSYINGKDPILSTFSFISLVISDPVKFYTLMKSHILSLVFLHLWCVSKEPHYLIKSRNSTDVSF